MKILVTGSAGHLGEAIMRTFAKTGAEAIGSDLVGSRFTDRVGTITDREFVRQSLTGIDAVIHSAGLHKPHAATQSRHDFVDINVTGTLNLLEESVEQGVRVFVFTSTTSAFGDALTPGPGMPAAWITEAVTPIPRSIYGITKTAAEDLCRLFHRKHKLACIVLRTSRFFPEEDDSSAIRNAFDDTNAKVNEFLFRRVDIEDAANAHIAALEQGPRIGFGSYIVSATTPFLREDVERLRSAPDRVVGRRAPGFESVYVKRGWKHFANIDRVYVNRLARDELGWRPKYDFQYLLGQLEAGETPGSSLARVVGSKGYHSEVFDDGPYPVD